MLSKDLNWKLKSEFMLRKQTEYLVCLKEHFTVEKIPSMWRNLYVSLVRLHIVQAWNPYVEKDIMKIENVQKKR